MRNWNIHEYNIALKTKLNASQKFSNSSLFTHKSELAFNEMKFYMHCMNIHEKFSIKIMHNN